MAFAKQEAAAINAAAALRNYHVRPRLGAYNLVQGAYCVLITHKDYRTVSAVNGPLVILDNVKVSVIVRWLSDLFW